MTDKTVKDLREIEKYVVKLRKNFKRVDLDYTVQVSINSTDPKRVVYAMQMTPPANGLAPVTMIADSAAELVKRLKISIEHMDHKAVEIAWHEAQILSCENTKKGHEERIADIKKEDEENASTEETADK